MSAPLVPGSWDTPPRPQSIAVAMIVDLICAWVNAGLASSMRAATPATNGVAMLVPSNVTYGVAPLLPFAALAEVICTPGAATSGLIRPSTVGPRLEKPARLKPGIQESSRPGVTPVSAIAPTVSAFGAAPGPPIVQGAGPLLPAATRTTRPAATAASAASDAESVPSEHSLSPSERLIASIPYVALFSTTHWMPETTPAVEPEPPAARTFTPTSAAPGATPL